MNRNTTRRLQLRSPLKNIPFLSSRLQTCYRATLIIYECHIRLRRGTQPTIVESCSARSISPGVCYMSCSSTSTRRLVGEPKKGYFYAGQRTTSKSEDLADEKRRLRSTDAFRLATKPKEVRWKLIFISLKQKGRKLDEEGERAFEVGGGLVGRACFYRPKRICAFA